jgi:hypothetical protein
VPAADDSGNRASREAGVGNRYILLVRGPSPVFPRGCLWAIPLWYAVIAALVYFSGRLPTWYAPIALGALAVAALTVLAVLGTMRNNAFAADENGITLGLRGGAMRRLGRRRRQHRHLPWTEIQQVSISPRRYGARLEVALSPAAGIEHFRKALPGRVAATVLLLILPLTYVFRAPGLLAPRDDPPRYRFSLCDVAAGDLTDALAALAAPADVAITLTSRWRRGAAAPPAPPALPGRAQPAAALSSAEMLP